MHFNAFGYTLRKNTVQKEIRNWKNIAEERWKELNIFAKDGSYKIYNKHSSG